jgi:hypothetical protein
MTGARHRRSEPVLGRRGFLRFLVAGGASVALGAHTPYGQWTVYRQRNLFIVASRTDEKAVALARLVVSGLARELPQARARTTRATDPVRIASLLATGQLDVAVVARSEAQAMLAGSGEYRAVGPTPLRVIAALGEHVLVSVEGLKERHAYLLAQAVDHMRPELPADTSGTMPPQLPEHPGARASRLDRALPEAHPGEKASAAQR